MSRGEPEGELEFTLPAAPDRPARLVRQTLYREQVTLPVRKGAPVVSVTAILAREEHPPVGQEAIEWRLLTNRAAETLEDIVQLMDWYRRRWLIEIFSDLEIGLQDGHPGPTAIWEGMQKVRAFAIALEASRAAYFNDG